MPILPQQLSIDDANIDFAIRRVDLKPLDVTNLKVSSRIPQAQQSVVAGIA